MDFSADLIPYLPQRMKLVRQVLPDHLMISDVMNY